MVIKDNLYLENLVISARSARQNPKDSRLHAEPTTPHALTLPSGDSFAIQPGNSSKCIPSFTAWMEARNILMAVTVVHKPSKAKN